MHEVENTHTYLHVLLPMYFRVYCHQSHFQRFLKLLSNDVMKKAKNIIGASVLEEPAESLSNLKLALRICAAFRGCYLDFREKVVTVLKKLKEDRESQTQGEGDANAAAGDHSGLGKAGGGEGGKRAGVRVGRKGGGGNRRGGGGGGGGGGGSDKAPAVQEFSYCSWPPRNSPVFSSINGIMERCNDLLELVQTLLDFL